MANKETIMICPNPYCPNPTGGTRLPTAEETSRLRNELEEQISQFVKEVNKRSELKKRLLDILDKLDKKEIALQICRTCNTWIAEIYDSEKGKIRQLIASPFKFNVGDQVKVTLEGEHCGMVGVVTRRMRWAKLIMPPPPSENVYYVVFEGNSKDYGYGEANLVNT